MSTTVEETYAEFQGLLKLLNDQGEISLRSSADDWMRKTLLLGAASHFEDAVTSSIIAFVERTSSSPLVCHFVAQKGLERRYHTLFDWKKRNANQFFSAFGQDFAQHMKETVRSDPDLEKQIEAFMEIGGERNRLVHENFVGYSLEKTAGEIYSLYLLAAQFVEKLPSLFEGFQSSA